MSEWYKSKAQVEAERQEGEAQRVRHERHRLLSESDYAVLPDAPVANVDEWKRYRQSLRDVPQQSGFPLDVTWPEKP